MEHITLKIKSNIMIIFLVISVIFYELLLKISLTGFSINTVLFSIFTVVLFSLAIATFLSLITAKFRSYIFAFVMFFLTAVYFSFFIYFKVFQTPLSLYSFRGASDVYQFRSIIINTISNNLLYSFLFFLPVLSLIAFKKINISLSLNLGKKQLIFMMIFSFVLNSLFISVYADNNLLVYRLLYEINDPSQNLSNLGLLHTLYLDFSRNILGNNVSELDLTFDDIEDNTLIDNINDQITEYNALDIDFKGLISLEKNSNILEIHSYFSKQIPTEKNEYTGLFKNHNLIMITAEALHTIAIHPEITPTLYMMANEGFVFNNFYNPLWGVSTTDGEYVACVGLLPKPGVWSFTEAIGNYLPYTMGNQFKSLNFNTYAYHNHTYTYYNRHKTHPSIGYLTYKGVGNGLVMRNTWPRSDLEMIEKTLPDFIDNSKFHAYYMSVSGHFEYTFNDNYMATKNRKFVDHLPYSERAKGYLAANLEFEFAMKYLVESLEEQGIADNTVIVISPDHHPYGLNFEEMSELSKTPINNMYDAQKSVFIIWKQGMEPIIVDKRCSSLDIIPTLSNLFGLEFDSRLLPGTDILSSAEPLVIFRNYSWLNENGFFDSELNRFFPYNLDSIEPSYVSNINRKVSEKFYFSSKVLDHNYFSYLR